MSLARLRWIFWFSPTQWLNRPATMIIAYLCQNVNSAAPRIGFEPMSSNLAGRRSSLLS